MRFREFISEAVLARASINSIPLYIDAVNELLDQQKNLPMGSQGQFSFQPSPGQSINSLEDAIAGSGQDHNGKSVDQIQAKQIYKSQEILTIAKGKSSEGVSYNKGEVAEGIHATAAFTRLITRPSRKIQLNDLYPIIDRLNNKETLVLKAKEVDSDIADEFHLTVSLKKNQWEAFKQLDKIAQSKRLSTVAKNIIDDANQESGKFADMYQKNGKFDLVRVVGDGVSGERETKTDINFENETERKYKGYSIKAGTTDQLHQVGGGKLRSSAEDKFNIINDELFGVHGRARLVDISSDRDSFVKLWNSGKIFTAYRKAYEAAVDKINQQLSSDQEENEFVKNLVTALKYWMRRDEQGIVLKQFTGTKKGTYILDAEKLNNLQNQGLNLVAQMASTQDPTLVIKDSETEEILVSIRAKSEERKDAQYYFRNYINKGPLFVKLTDISEDT